jgi:hypothetical protein
VQKRLWLWRYFISLGGMLLSVSETSFTLRCNLCTLNVAVHCKGAWLSRSKLYSLCAVMGV